MCTAEKITSQKEREPAVHLVPASTCAGASRLSYVSDILSSGNPECGVRMRNPESENIFRNMFSGPRNSREARETISDRVENDLRPRNSTEDSGPRNSNEAHETISDRVGNVLGTRNSDGARETFDDRVGISGTRTSDGGDEARETILVKFSKDELEARETILVGDDDQSDMPTEDPSDDPDLHGVKMTVSPPRMQIQGRGSPEELTSRIESQRVAGILAGTQHEPGMNPSSECEHVELTSPGMNAMTSARIQSKKSWMWSPDFGFAGFS